MNHKINTFICILLFGATAATLTFAQLSKDIGSVGAATNAGPAGSTFTPIAPGSAVAPIIPQNYNIPAPIFPAQPSGIMIIPGANGARPASPPNP